MLQLIKVKTILFLLICTILTFSTLFYWREEVHAREIKLEWLENITNSKLKEQSSTINGNRFFIYSWPGKYPAEILILHMPNESAAKKEADRLLLLIETGRTKGRLNANISSSYIGDYSIKPGKITDDPHGFEMKDSDKTFIIFTRKNVVVVVDSKRNAEPQIDVLGIAKKIDNELVE